MIGIEHKCRVRLNAARRLVAVNPRKLNVHQDEARPLPRYGRYRFLAGLCLRHLVVRALEQITQDLSIVLLILHHQNEPAHAGLVFCSTVTGSVNEKVDPSPGRDSTQMRPPCSSTMRLEIVSPSPVPPFSRVIAESAC